MNADRMVETPAKRARRGKALGSEPGRSQDEFHVEVIINLQKTRLDSEATVAWSALLLLPFA